MKPALICLLLFLAACNSAPKQEALSGDYPIQPVNFTKVHFNDEFWAPRLQKHEEVTLAYTLDQCDSTKRILNFEIAAGRKTGKFNTVYPFDDSDVYKIVEGASYALQVKANPALDARLDSLIDLFGDAAEDDGYLYTNRTIDPVNTHPWAGHERWELCYDNSHELYNMGHFYEAAVAHYLATGKRSMLDLAIKNADLICNDFGPGKIERIPGHQVIEMGLAKLYRITGDPKYLKEAQFFLDLRGGDPKDQYRQNDIKVVDQRKAVGHAVRAGYMYSGMADVAALTGNQAYITAIDSIWEDVVRGKIYVTGGIGATGNNEGFAEPYALPNYSAYCETCASIANVFWNHRLFLLHGHAKYIDVLERTLYNALLSGLSLSGDRFFYPNVLEARRNRERSPWFSCACCPSNMARFLPSIPGYQYAVRNNELYVNLYIGGHAEIDLGDNTVQLDQSTRYPFDGRVNIAVTPARTGKFTLKLRIPGWAQNEAIASPLYWFDQAAAAPVTVSVNGKTVNYKVVDGYAVISRKWKEGDNVKVDMPMPVRRVFANEHVKSDLGRQAFQRGPLIYCFEGQDQPRPETIHYLVDKDAPAGTAFEKDLLNGVQTITVQGRFLEETESGPVETPATMKAIPYYAWANRGKDYMSVWVPYDKDYATALPAPSIASRSKVSASEGVRGNVEVVADRINPAGDESPYIHWWPKFGTREWLQYDFQEAARVSSVQVYWFDDSPNGGCRIPASWKLLYRKNGRWQEVPNPSGYSATKDAFDRVTFDPVTTDGLRLEMQLQEGVSAGVYEWVVE